ncbi:MAG: Crp/Fnr family transcriptional regulator [Microscillaceae bacterium]|nr:Crp/Fnr family transcriptional regulator [Microscillaceae bacterium]
MNNLLTYINSISPISKDTEIALSRLFEKKVIDKDYIIVKSEEISKELFFLEEGVIRTYITNDTGIEYNKAFDIPPAITCGYASLITGKPSKVNLQSLTKCILWVANYHTIKELYRNHPDLERFARIAAELSFVEKENRELEMALLNADIRYEYFKKQFPQLEQMIPQYHIASYLGISPTQLSRIRNGLSKLKK